MTGVADSETKSNSSQTTDDPRLKPRPHVHTQPGRDPWKVRSFRSGSSHCFQHYDLRVFPRTLDLDLRRGEEGHQVIFEGSFSSRVQTPRAWSRVGCRRELGPWRPGGTSSQGPPPQRTDTPGHRIQVRDSVPSPRPLLLESSWAGRRYTRSKVKDSGRRTPVSEWGGAPLPRTTGRRGGCGVPHIAPLFSSGPTPERERRSGTGGGEVTREALGPSLRDVSRVCRTWSLTLIGTPAAGPSGRLLDRS